MKAVLEEALSIFPGQCISCVLSIGSGGQGITGFKSTSTTVLAKVLRKVMDDGEHISDEELSDKEYCRSNVDHGLDDIDSRIGTHTGIP